MLSKESLPASVTLHPYSEGPVLLTRRSSGLPEVFKELHPCLTLQTG